MPTVGSPILRHVLYLKKKKRAGSNLVISVPPLFLFEFLLWLPSGSVRKIKFLPQIVFDWSILSKQQKR